MPDARDPGQENLMLAFRVLLVSGLLLVLAAVFAYASGRDNQALEGSSRVDATLVLGSLGVVLIVAAVLVVLEARTRTPSDR